MPSGRFNIQDTASLAASKKYRFRREAEGDVITGWRGTMTICGNVPGRPGRGYVRRMIDDWNEKLRCPMCRKTAMASLSQAEGDDTPTVKFVQALGS
jgi:hypothetical protein